MLPDRSSSSSSSYSTSLIATILTTERNRVLLNKDTLSGGTLHLDHLGIWIRHEIILPVDLGLEVQSHFIWEEEREGTQTREERVGITHAYREVDLRRAYHARICTPVVEEQSKSHERQVKEVNTEEKGIEKNPLKYVASVRATFSIELWELIGNLFTGYRKTDTVSKRDNHASAIKVETERKGDDDDSHTGMQKSEPRANRSVG
ncbi:hypothetical protein EV361DRAFT_869258 [Lentinula raphanica]|nr:hypothetical protein EV361DRAFT_869258 [Lentinula raphanica]